jgi:hypothetical protein
VADYHKYLDAVLSIRKPRQPDEFTVGDVAQRLGSESSATKWVADRLAAGLLSRRKLGKLFLYKPESPNGQGPKETIKP